MSVLLSEVFNPRSIKINLEGTTKEAVLAELAGEIAVLHPECERSVMLAAIMERENKLSTGVAPGVAIPHGFCRGIRSMAGAIGISRNGIDYEALDNKPVHIVFMLAIGGPASENHLRVLNQIARLATSEALAMIMNAKSAEDIHGILARVN